MADLKTELKQTLEILKSGGIILYPTDTIWGIGCDATNEAAIERVYKLKKRSESKSMIILLDQPGRLQSYLREVPEQALNLIEYSEYPLTIVYDQSKNLPDNLVQSDGSIAIRITKDEFCMQLIERLRKPLVSTSANISGEKFPGNFSEVSEFIRKGVDYVVDLKQDEKKEGKPSSIIRMKNNGEFRFIRK